MPLISSPPSTSRRDFEPHGPEGTRETSSSAGSVSNYHSFKYVPNEYSFKYVPNEYLVLTLTVQTRAERPCSRYAQIAVTVA